MKKYLVLVVLFSLLVGVSSVNAATIPVGFNTWTEQTTMDTQKVWTIKFSAPMDIQTMNSGNIYVTDESNVLVKTTLTRSTDGASVLVKPDSAYTAGKKYWLFITGDITTNSGGQQLAKPQVMPFMIALPNDMISVSHTYSSLFTSFTVVTSSEVCSVKINQSEMMYQGNNTFELGMTGLKQGANVKVYTYDSEGKRLRTQTHKVD